MFRNTVQFSFSRVCSRTHTHSPVTVSAKASKKKKKEAGAPQKKDPGHEANSGPLLDSNQQRGNAGGPTGENISQPQEESPNPTAFSRQAVLEACLKTTLAISAAGAGLRLAAQPIADNVPLLDGAAVHSLLSNEAAPWHAAVVAGLVAVVTGGRLALLSFWPDYRTASDRSNGLVLKKLSTPDLLWVSFLPGFSEELLFSGALLPALGADWKAVCLTGLIFGILHREGGRNLAFASWAVVVGWAYSSSYLLTHDLLVPASAHSLANLAAAFTWKQSNKGPTP